MAKKKTQTESSEEVEVITPDVKSQEQETTEVVETKAQTKKAKKETKSEQTEKKVVAKKPSKKTKTRKSLKRTATEVLSEFQKVSKPSFGKVVKNTCVVVAVVAICTVLLFGMDKLFSLLYNLLIS
ncbi:MAG: preprotein translocase subunit SecE [Clostridiales bacterium]|nr:preprotein translocase subunit SecE [Clostridiales bacterium]